MIRNNVISAASDDYELQRQLIAKFKAELCHLPNGSLYLRTIRGKKRFYHYVQSGSSKNPATQTYIGKDGENLKRALARRKFIEKSLAILENNIRLEENLLQGYVTYNPTEVMENLPKVYKDLSSGLAFSMIEKNNSSSWAKEPYTRNELYPEKLIHKTTNGLRVRSKSEAIIASQLELNHISFRYEALLNLDGARYYPDFTILNPQDNQVIYWEHFGMIDMPDYAASMEKKLAIYRKYGILQWNNLIVTYETKSNPLNAQNIRKIIKAFLLP